MTLDEAKKLAVKILSKTLDATKLTADKGIIIYYVLNYVKNCSKFISGRNQLKIIFL